MPQAMRYRPTAWPASALGMSFSKNCTKAKKEIQNAPYDVNAVAPNVLPVLNSHMPASSCASPPYVSARPKTIGSLADPIRLALIMLSTNVVRANAARPSGPGSAVTCAIGALAASVSPRTGSRAVPASIGGSSLQGLTQEAQGGPKATALAPRHSVTRSDGQETDFVRAASGVGAGG